MARSTLLGLAGGEHGMQQMPACVAPPLHMERTESETFNRVAPFTLQSTACVTRNMWSEIRRHMVGFASLGSRARDGKLWDFSKNTPVRYDTPVISTEFAVLAV